MNKENIQLKPCPFCGFQVDQYGLDDVLYPSGTFWRPHEEVGRIYIGPKERLSNDNPCWVINCVEIAGGCGASMDGDSIEETIEKWNRRND